MTIFQAQQIIDDELHIEAVLDYRRNPIESSDRTYRRAVLWIEAEHIISSNS